MKRCCFQALNYIIYKMWKNTPAGMAVNQSGVYHTVVIMTFVWNFIHKILLNKYYKFYLSFICHGKKNSSCILIIFA